MTFDEFVVFHKEARRFDHLRIGQRFCNDYVLASWPALFYEQDNQKCLDIIKKWLSDHQYMDMPPRLVR